MPSGNLPRYATTSVNSFISKGTQLVNDVFALEFYKAAVFPCNILIMFLLNANFTFKSNKATGNLDNDNQLVIIISPARYTQVIAVMLLSRTNKIFVILNTKLLICFSLGLYVLRTLFPGSENNRTTGDKIS